MDLVEKIRFEPIEINYCCGFCKKYAETRFIEAFVEKVWDVLNSNRTIFPHTKKLSWGVPIGWQNIDISEVL